MKKLTLHHLLKYQRKNLRLLLSTLVFVTGFYSAKAQFAGGNGTVSNPWQIATLDQLNNVRNYPGSSFILIADLDFTGSTYNNSSEGWEPIGASFSTAFTGTFNGNGHTIGNLYINRPSAYYVGLFGVAKGAKINNLGITDYNVSGEGAVGALAGYNDYGTIISNCYAEGNVTGTGWNVGGLVGRNDGNSSISDSHALGQVSGNYAVGGLVGYNYDSSTVNNCYTENSVSATGNNVGGLVGYNEEAVIENSHSGGSISGNYQVGGLAGYNYKSSAVTNCYATGSVSGNSEVGGLVGENYYNSTISSSYAIGVVSGTYMDAGGLAGKNSSSVIRNCYATGGVTGSNNVGGLAGINSGSSSINNCYAIGKVLGNIDVGGFVGENGATINNAYFNNQISGQSNGIGTDNTGTQYVTGLSTAQMKQGGNFTGFDFSTVWNITNGLTFPCLQAVYDVPVILKNLSGIAKINAIYSDTIQVVQMDNAIQSITLEDEPEGMSLQQDSIIVWIPGSTGIFSFTIKATDTQGAFSEYNHAIRVITFSGDGTKENPYQITTIEQLDSVRTMPDKHYILMNDLDFAGSAYDSINSAEGWEPIGYWNSDTDNEYFTGSFNGNGHTITGLYINRSSNHVGLFGDVQNAEINNLGIINCNVKGGNSVGGILGGGISITVDGCYCSGIISGDDNVGGVAGSGSSLFVTNCYFTGSVIGENEVGGIVGSSSLTISNCYNTGSVTGEFRVGGIVGYIYSSALVTKCYSIGYLTGETFAGGIIGDFHSSTINSCYYNIETTGQSNGAGGGNSASVDITGLTTAQMKLAASFDGWGINTGEAWGIVEGYSYPALKTLANNAPFAFADNLSRKLLASLTEVLDNDYDYETQQSKLTFKVVNCTNHYGSLSGDIYTFDNGINLGDTDTISYRVGELMAEGDTLWGNQAQAFVIKGNTSPKNDASLSSISIDGDVLPEFASSIFDYEVELPFGTIQIPIVTATSTDLEATVEITQAPQLPGTVTIHVTAADGETQQTYTVEFTIAPNNDASLSSISVDREALPEFTSSIFDYEVELPYGTTQIPTVTATSADLEATVEITQAAELPGTATILVTAADGEIQQTYIVEFTLALNNDASLSSISVDGEALPEFSSSIFDYEVELPYGITQIPTVSATSTDLEATVEITQSPQIPGAATIMVTAADGETKQTYTVEFVIALNDDASLSSISVDGDALPEFSSSIFDYEVELPYGTTQIPTVSATSTDIEATVEITQALQLPGTATIHVTAADGETQQIYSVNFTVAANNDASLLSIMIGGESLGSFSSGVYNYLIELPFGTSNAPEVYATATDPEAEVSIIQAGELPGTATILVTAADGQTQQSYTIEFSTTLNNDASLSNIYLDGVLLEEFNSDILEYNIELPEGTTEFPEVKVTTNDPEATYNIIQASENSDSAKIIVTAADGISMSEYIIHFTIETDVFIQINEITLKLYPNPFNNEITFFYSLNKPGFVSIVVHTINGEVLAQILNERQLAGNYHFNWKVNNLPAGIYICKIQLGDFFSHKKIIKK